MGFLMRCVCVSGDRSGGSSVQLGAAALYAVSPLGGWGLDCGCFGH